MAIGGHATAQKTAKRAVLGGCSYPKTQVRLAGQPQKSGGAHRFI